MLRSSFGLSLRLFLVEPWTWDGDIPQGCPLSMVFTVALYVLWSSYLADQVGFPSSYVLNRAVQNSSETKNNSLAFFLRMRMSLFRE